jgi:hypothetical protein
MMTWYIFYTPRGWAAILSEKKTLVATVFGPPAPRKTQDQDKHKNRDKN